MATKLELIYDIRERINAYSDDIDITNEYLSYLIDKYRVDILVKRYSTLKRRINQVNKQRIELNTVGHYAPNYNGGIIKSIESIPNLILSINNDNITTISNGQLDSFPFNMISSEQFPYVGLDNPFIRNLYYGAVLDDDKLYVKSWNRDLLLTETIRLWGVFSSPEDAWELSVEYDSNLDFETDIEYPLESNLIPDMINTIIQRLLIKYQVPKDNINDAAEPTANPQD